MNAFRPKDYTQAIQTHLGILQGVIQRMAANSGSGKAYCVTLVSAILVIVADKGRPQYALIALIPIILFSLLDTYYLGQEKAFRARYKDFVLKYHGNRLAIEDMYEIAPLGKFRKHLGAAFWSFSVIPFYVTLLGMVTLAKNLVIPAK